AAKAPTPAESAEQPALEPASVPTTATPVTIADLVAARLIGADEELHARSGGLEHVARLHDSVIELNGNTFSSLSAAAVSITGKPTNGWTFWRVQAGGTLIPLSELRQRLATSGR